MAEKQHTSCIQQHCVEASADSLHTNYDQSPRLVESPLDRVWDLGGFTLPEHCSTSASQIEPTSCFVQSALQFTAAVRLMATRSTCVSNCARGSESIRSGIGVVWSTHPGPKPICREFLSNGMGATTSVLLIPHHAVLKLSR